VLKRNSIDLRIAEDGEINSAEAIDRHDEPDQIAWCFSLPGVLLFGNDSIVNQALAS